jgi:hypothetical protein
MTAGLQLTHCFNCLLLSPVRLLIGYHWQRERENTVPKNVFDCRCDRCLVLEDTFQVWRLTTLFYCVVPLLECSVDVLLTIACVAPSLVVNQEPY